MMSSSLFGLNGLLIRLYTATGRVMVRPIAGPLSCSLSHLPATTNLLGKRRLSAQYENGWTFPRDVMEALEAVAEIPLPARFGFWAVPRGVAVEVVTSDATAACAPVFVAISSLASAIALPLVVHVSSTWAVDALPWPSFV